MGMSSSHRIMLIVVAGAMVALSGGAAGIVRAANEADASAHRDFIESFHNAANARNYVNTIDALIDDGVGRIFDSAAELDAADGSTSKRTENGIALDLANYRAADSLIHHLAVSRDDFLPRDFATTIVALFANRAGLLLPRVVKLGEDHVYHVVWEASPDDGDNAASIVAERRQRARQRSDAREVLTDATINARQIRVERLVP